MHTTAGMKPHSKNINKKFSTAPPTGRYRFQKKKNEKIFKKNTKV